MFSSGPGTGSDCKILQMFYIMYYINTKHLNHVNEVKSLCFSFFLHLFLVVLTGGVVPSEVDLLKAGGFSQQRFKTEIRNVLVTYFQWNTD